MKRSSILAAAVVAFFVAACGDTTTNNNYYGADAEGSQSSDAGGSTNAGPDVTNPDVSEPDVSEPDANLDAELPPQPSNEILFTDDASFPSEFGIGAGMNDCFARVIASVGEGEEVSLNEIAFANYNGTGSIEGHVVELLVDGIVVGTEVIASNPLGDIVDFDFSLTNDPIIFTEGSMANFCLRFEGGYNYDPNLVGKTIHFTIQSWEAWGQESLVQVPGGNNHAGSMGTFFLEVPPALDGELDFFTDITLSNMTIGPGYDGCVGKYLAVASGQDAVVTTITFLNHGALGENIDIAEEGMAFELEVNGTSVGTEIATSEGFQGHVTFNAEWQVEKGDTAQLCLKFAGSYQYDPNLTGKVMSLVVQDWEAQGAEFANKLGGKNETLNPQVMTFGSTAHVEIYNDFNGTPDKIIVGEEDVTVACYEFVFLNEGVTVKEIGFVKMGVAQLPLPDGIELFIDGEYSSTVFNYYNAGVGSQYAEFTVDMTFAKDTAHLFCLRFPDTSLLTPGTNINMVPWTFNIVGKQSGNEATINGNQLKATLPVVAPSGCAYTVGGTSKTLLNGADVELGWWEISGPDETADYLLTEVVVEVAANFEIENWTFTLVDQWGDQLASSEIIFTLAAETSTEVTFKPEFSFDGHLDLFVRASFNGVQLDDVLAVTLVGIDMEDKDGDTVPMECLPAPTITLHAN